MISFFYFFFFLSSSFVSLFFIYVDSKVQFLNSLKLGTQKEEEMNKLEHTLEEEKQRVHDLEILVRNLQETEKRMNEELQGINENWKEKEGTWKQKVEEMVEKYMEMEIQRDKSWKEREEELQAKLDGIMKEKEGTEDSLRRSLGEWEEKEQSWKSSQGQKEKWKKKKNEMRERMEEMKNELENKTNDWESAHAEIATLEAVLIDNQNREEKLEKALRAKEEEYQLAELEMKKEIEQREIEWTEVLATKIQELIDGKEGEWQTKELSLKNELQKMVEEFHTMGEMREKELREREEEYHQALTEREYEWREREEVAMEDLERSIRMRDEEFEMTSSQMKKEFDQIMHSSEMHWKGNFFIILTHFLLFLTLMVIILF